MISELSVRGAIVAIGILLTLLIAATAFDLRSRRVPNQLIILGLVSASLLAGFSGSRGVMWSAAGLVAGLAIFYPVYAAG